MATGFLRGAQSARAGIARFTWAMPLAFMLLAGCQAPPPPEQVKTDVAAVLATAAPPGLLAPEAVSVSKVTGVMQGQIVDFSAELRLQRDYAFGGWDQV